MISPTLIIYKKTKFYQQKVKLQKFCQSAAGQSCQSCRDGCYADVHQNAYVLYSNLIFIMNNESLPSIDPLAKLLQSPTKNSSAPLSALAASPSPSKPPQNAKIVSNYLLGKNIGQGTFGKVHLALHLPTSEKVAVKIIDKKSMHRPKDVMRVKNQIAVLNSVRHRNLLHLYEIIQTQKSVLLITQHLENGELFRLIIKEKKLSQDQACLYFQQIVAGVEYLHRNKIAHRDLKPQNILLDYDNQVKIIDFGLSTALTKGKDIKQFCGSPCYAAPEIIEGKVGYNPLLSDLWSLGVILFVMLAGYLPFCDQDVNTVYRQILACNYKIPSFVSAAAKDLIQSLLEKTPNKRISIKDIRDHEWFNRSAPQPAYGINKGQKIKPDYDIIQRLKEINVDGNKVREGLQKNEKNKDTASYFIFMKKLYKNNEKVESYIGASNFNTSFIEADANFYQNDTQTLSDPNTTILEAVEGPQMPKEFKEMTSSCSNINQFYLKSQQFQRQKEVSKEELYTLVNGIFNFIFSLQQKKDPIEEVLGNIPNAQNRIKKIIFDKKEADFYKNKKNKQERDLVFKVIEQKPVVARSVKYRKLESLTQKDRKMLQDKKELKTTTSEKKEEDSTKTNKSKKKTSLLDSFRLSMEVKKNVQKLLPYLDTITLSKLLQKRQRSNSFVVGATKKKFK